LDTNSTLKLSNASLHLKQASVSSVGVVVEDFNLAMNLHMSLFLVSVLALDLLRQLILFVQRLVLALDDVHLEDGTTRVLLRSYDLHLASVVLDLRHNINKDLLKALELSTERHVVLVLQAKHGIRAGNAKCAV